MSADISEGEFWCELADLLGHTTQGRDGVDAPLRMTRRQALEMVSELLDNYDDLNASYGDSNERIVRLGRELEQAHNALVKDLKDKSQ